MSSSRRDDDCIHRGGSSSGEWLDIVGSYTTGAATCAPSPKCRLCHPESMAETEARWWEIRRAQNLSASVYTCPLCDERLPALSEHLLITPEGDSARRRHAHTECVREARRIGRLPTQDEWVGDRSRSPSAWKRWIARLRGGS
jgi:hypothetical protein